LSWLLDTNVVSEPSKGAPDLGVLAWIAAQPLESLFLSAVTVAEVAFGVASAPAGARRTALERWYAASVEVAQILPVDRPVAEAWAVLRRRAESQGRPMPLLDAFLAATADVHGLTLVTRNVRDFDVWGGPLLNPWDAAR